MLEQEVTVDQGVKLSKSQKDENEKHKVYKWDIVWHNVVLVGSLYFITFYTLYFLYYKTFTATRTFAKLYCVTSILGVTAGYHRLWCHRSYKAKWPAQVILMIAATMTFQNSVYVWCRDHRLHHKCSETDGDPHNAKRGFFFSHVGWLMVRKHEDVKRMGKTIDMSDLKANPIVMFQHKYYYFLVSLLTFIIPTCVPWYFFGESLLNAFMVSLAGYFYSVNLVWCINSVSHLYGSKPYDKYIGPTSNLCMRYLGLGEGFHNYHHTFPWDYKAAELRHDVRNITTAIIDGFAGIGWVTDRKSVPEDVIMKRMAMSGDGSTLKPSEESFMGIKSANWLHLRSFCVITFCLAYLL